MVRIGGSTDKGRHIKEADYFTPQGEFRVDRDGSPILLNCLMYKMCYYRFGQVYTEQGVIVSELCSIVNNLADFFSPGKPSGYDRVRNAEIGNKVWSVLRDCMKVMYSSRTLNWMCWKKRTQQSTGLCAFTKSKTFSTEVFRCCPNLTPSHELIV